jgi:hypothetical protein
VCRLQRRYAAAARLYADAFTADAILADDLKAAHRYHAACFAALAAAGQGTDADKLDDQERSRLRKQALDWLQADLNLWDKRLADDNPEARQVAQNTLRHWQADSDLTGVRDAAVLKMLPDKEREAWRKLWADVEDLIKKVLPSVLLEGEKLTMRGSSDKFYVFLQDMKPWPNGRWSGNAQMHGHPTTKGAWLDLAVPIPKDGTYLLVAHMTRAPDYGIVRFSLAGKVLGASFDGYDPEVVSPVPVSLGRVELKKGTAVLRLETVDANPKATANRYYWGLDCLVLTPVK